ncbi:MAG: hypothetical protein J5717_04945 [Lachnospiraceae bacterium]|nr:hypothetical protein [Lachnospiraceae bacterium]
MTEYVLLDVGMGGLVVLFGGAAVVIFIVVAIIIVRASIKAIKKEITGKPEMTLGSLMEGMAEEAIGKQSQSENTPRENSHEEN